MEDEDDTHLCLSCQQTIIGLDNYVKNRKSECPAKKAVAQRNNQAENVQNNASENQISCEAIEERKNSQTTVVSGLLSSFAGDSYGSTTVSTPSTSVAASGYSVNTNAAVTVTENATNFDEPAADPVMFADFFSSLELQSRTPSHPPKPGASDEKIVNEPRPKSPDPFHGASEMEPFDQTKHLFENSKTLKIANLLNELNFSSDSEGFNEDFLNFSDIDEELDTSSHNRPRLYGKWKPGMQHYPGKHSPGKGGKHKTSGKVDAHHKHTDKGNANPPGRHRGKLDIYNDAVDDNTGGETSSLVKGERSPRGHTGKLEAYKRHHKVDKLVAYKRSMDAGEDAHSDADSEDEGQSHVKTRSRSGKRVRYTDTTPANTSKTAHTKHHIGGKRWPVSEPDEDTDVENNDVSPKISDSQFECKPCGRSFSTAPAFGRHSTSKSHKEMCQKDPNKSDIDAGYKARQKKEESYMQCPICYKHFYSKFTFARHLVSPGHVRKIIPRSAEEKKELEILNEGMQHLLKRLKPFQCRICDFYASRNKDMLTHMQTDDHLSKCKDMICPMKCSKCKFSTNNSDTMYQHFSNSSSHQTHGKNEKPIVLKEQKSNIPCEICEKVIHSKAQYKHHLKFGHQKKKERVKRAVKTKPSCAYCGQVCNTAYALTIHIRRKHTKERPHKCEHCDVTFTDKSTLNLHNKSRKHLQKLAELSENPLHKSKLSQLDDDGAHFEGMRSYKCDHCHFRTTDHDELRPHYMQEHAMNVYNCDICGLTFIRERMYETHIKSATHKKKAELAEMKGYSIFSCTLCHQMFYNERSFRIHELFHKNCRPDEKTMALVLEDLDEKYHEFVKGLKFDDEQMLTRFQCPECKKRLPQEKMIAHLRIHSNKDPYKCLFCKKGMRDRIALRLHLESHVQGTKVSCQYCEKQFIAKKSLKRHIFMKHRDTVEQAKIDKCTCDTCGKVFADKISLKAHMLTHADKKVKCPHEGCRLSFRLQCELDLHYRTHTGERPYLCDMCGYAGKTQHQLTRHKLVHTRERNFPCEYCTYKAANSTNLRRHMRIHIGSKPYCCPYCDYRANCVENIRKHILKTKQHAGMVIYPCKKCDFGTNLAREIREHLVDKHGADSNSTAISSIYTGLYEKDTDVSAIPEGGLVHPVGGPADDNQKTRKKRGRLPKAKSRLRSNPANTDHAYVQFPDKKIPQDAEDAMLPELNTDNSTDSQIENQPPPVPVLLHHSIDVKQDTHVVQETLDDVQNFQYLIEVQTGELPPYFDVQVEFVDTGDEDVVEETVITQDIIDQVLPPSTT